MTSEADNLAAVSVKTRRRTDFLSSGNISCFDNNTYESTSAGEAPPRSITARPSFHSPLDSFHSFHSQPLFAISRYFSLAGPRGDWTYDDPNGIRFTKRETNLQRKSCKKSARRPGAAITPSALGLLPRAFRRASVQDPSAHRSAQFSPRPPPPTSRLALAGKLNSQTASLSVCHRG